MLRNSVIKLKENHNVRQLANIILKRKKPTAEALDLNYPNCFYEQFPDLYPTALDIITDLRNLIKRIDFSSLAINSPGLENYDWQSYLNCSLIRMLQIQDALEKNLTPQKKVLDLGAYFGNFSMLCAKRGYSVDALDSYKKYGDVFHPILEKMKLNNIQERDFDDIGYDLKGFQAASFDAVLCLGVIEHIPHTPRQLLEAIDYVLKPGGILILETPNLAYIYNRQKLLEGKSIFTPLPFQYKTAIPFEGHHREYTIEEIEWLIKQLKYHEITIETYIYSLYQLREITGQDLQNYKVMQDDPSMREIILSISRKI